MRLPVVQGWLMILCWMVLSCERWTMAATVGKAGIEQPGAPPVDGCPLNVREFDSYPWMVHQCFAVEVTHCCEAINNLIRLLLFSWLRRTGFFLLPNNRTAAACLDAVHRHLKARGISDKLVMNCKLMPESFVITSESCNGIANIAGFERAVDPSSMRRYCNGSLPGVFQCKQCLKSMGTALDKLQKMGSAGDSNSDSNCLLFITMYVGGGINACKDLGPDAAYCLMGTVDLPALAPVSATWPISPFNRRTRTVNIGLAVVIPLVAMILLLSIHACLRWRKLYRLGLTRIRLLRRHQMLRESVDASTGLVFFALSEIKSSTRNFSASNVIGEGGFSTVYRGILSDGSEVAVKRFKHSTAEGEEEFLHEVQVISSVRHRNLLPLRGYCIGRSEQGAAEQLLVYDFMSNGSLADYLFRGNRPCLAWAERLKIAVGIAKGLAYLHRDAKPAIIHRDVKAANVLLEEDLNPLVADFGLAKFKQDVDKTHYTTRAVGTLGYVAPEYALYGHLTDKSDVFSFGILLLELISGRKALGGWGTSGKADEHLLISDWACDLMQKRMSEEVIDRRMAGSGAKESMERVILLGLQCAHPRVACRPSISQAQAILEAIDQPPPKEMIAMEPESSGAKGFDQLNWLVCPDVEGRILYGSCTTPGNISATSYWSGR